MNYGFCKWGANGKLNCVERFVDQEDPQTYDIVIRLVNKHGEDIYLRQFNKISYKSTDFIHRISFQGLEELEELKLVIHDMTDYQNFKRTPLQLLFKYNDRVKPGRIVFSDDIPLTIYQKRKAEMSFNKYMIGGNEIEIYFDISNMV